MMKASKVSVLISPSAWLLFSSSWLKSDVMIVLHVQKSQFSQANAGQLEVTGDSDNANGEVLRI